MSFQCQIVSYTPLLHIVIMDWWLKMGAFKTKRYNEHEIKTNSNSQQFLKEAETYSPSPSNVPFS
jgi:hypothetical protein